MFAKKAFIFSETNWYAVIIVYPDDIARLWHSDGHVLTEWYYFDHQSALAEYTLIPLSVLSLGEVSVCFTRPAMEKWRSLQPGSTQCE